MAMSYASVFSDIPGPDCFVHSVGVYLVGFTPHQRSTLCLKGNPTICRAGVFFLNADAFTKPLCRKDWILASMMRDISLSDSTIVRLHMNDAFIDLDELLVKGYHIGNETEERGVYRDCPTVCTFVLGEFRYEQRLVHEKAVNKKR